jgi:hypothetical protein
MTRERPIGVIIGVICTLAAFALFEIVRAQQSASQPIECVEPDLRESIRAIVLKGLDDAMRDRAQHLFEVWMRDERDQPKRASTGMQQAISAYIQSRSLALKWNPTPCKQ